jgi:hypothetical protein
VHPPSWTAIIPIGCHLSLNRSHSCRCILLWIAITPVGWLLWTAVIVAGASCLDCHQSCRLSSFSGLQSFLQVHPSWTAITPAGCHPSLESSYSCRCILPGLPSLLQAVILRWTAVLLAGASFLDCHHSCRLSFFAGLQTFL